MDEITTTIKKDNENIDDVLYLIKQNKFNVEILKKEHAIDINVITYYNENCALIEYEKNKYLIEEEARRITFRDDNQSTTKFIYNFDNLKDVIDKLKFKAIKIPNNEEDSCDSIDSEINEYWILVLFQKRDVVEIVKDKTELEKLIDKFNNRYSRNKIYISNLSLNSSYYFPDNKKDIINFEVLLMFIKDIKQFFVKDCNILYVVGPKGTSKSLFLMNYCYERNEANSEPILYINYRAIKACQKKNEKKNIFKKELIYLFFSEDELEKFYKRKTYEDITSEKLLKFIYNFIKDLLDNFENHFKKRILVVLDNFDDDNEEEITILNNLINLIKEENNRKKIKLIISGRCSFMYKKQYYYLKDELNIRTPNNREMLMYYNIELNKSIINDDNINNMIPPLFYFNTRNQNNLNDIIEEEREFCNKYNTFGMNYAILNEEKEIEISELEKYYQILPIDYIVFTKINNNKVSFKFHNKIFKNIIKKKIEFSIQADNFIYILKNFYKNRIAFGIFEEKLLILLLSYNKLDLENLQIREENRLEVFEIYQFKQSIYEQTNKPFIKNEPIIINQEYYLGKNYDLVILIPIPSINSYKAIFIQIGSNKSIDQINTIIKDLKKNKIKYINGIKKFIGVDITDVELVFIFDKDTQINLFKKNKISGAEYCIKKNIIFYLFSIENFRLYSTDNMIEFSLKKNFETFKPKAKHKRNYNESKGDFSFLSANEIKLINNFIHDNILSNYIIIQGGCNIGNLNQYEKDSIYIYYNTNKRIYIIKQHCYVINNGELIKILKKTININENFQSKKLVKRDVSKKLYKRIKKEF